MKHQVLDELLDDLDKTETGTREYFRANHAVTAYYNQAMMFDDNTIPNKLILKTYRVSFRKIGFIMTIRAILVGIKTALS